MLNVLTLFLIFSHIETGKIIENYSFQKSFDFGLLRF